MQLVYDYIKANGALIGEGAGKGDKLCLEIIAAYKMHFTCPSDPGAAGILQATIKEYRERKNGTN